jgi:hypothetical protein
MCDAPSQVLQELEATHPNVCGPETDGYLLVGVGTDIAAAQAWFALLRRSPSCMAGRTAA